MYGKRNEIPVFVKQLGRKLANEFKLKDKKGEDMDGWPDSMEMYKVREWPKVYNDYLIKNRSIADPKYIVNTQIKLL